MENGLRRQGAKRDSGNISRPRRQPVLPKRRKSAKISARHMQGFYSGREKTGQAMIAKWPLPWRPSCRKAAMGEIAGVLSHEFRERKRNAAY
jgi:hypothetical protein